MRQRGVHAKLRKTSGAEKHFREQAELSNAARFTRVASIEPTPGYLKGVTGNVPVAAEDAAGPLPEICDNNNVGLVITGAGFEPCFPLAHVVGRSQICVPVTVPDLQATEFVDQKEVDHAGNRVGAIHSRGAILQDVDVIDHREGNEVNVHASAEPDGVQRTKATRFPSTSTKVSLPNKPRRLNWTVPSPPLAMFRLTVPPASCGRKVVRSVALRMPSFSRSLGRYVSTGLGPVSSAVGMFDPVTITRSTSAT